MAVNVALIWSRSSFMDDCPAANPETPPALAKLHLPHNKDSNDSREPLQQIASGDSGSLGAALPAGLILLPASDAAQLLSYDYDTVRLSPAFGDSFDLSPSECEHLDGCLQMWIARADGLELQGLSSMTEEGESFYRIDVPKEDAKALIADIRAEISSMEPSKGDMIAEIILSNPRFYLLLESQEIQFFEDGAGGLYLDSSEFGFPLSSKSKENLAKANRRYGHLFDFSQIN
jgi:hypothetical protein